MNTNIVELPKDNEQNFSMILSCCKSNSNNFSYLIRLLQRNVVIPFIGAGISINYGYPGWTNFISKQADELNEPEAKNALANKEYEKAAELLKRKATKNVWEYILLQTFGDHVYKSSDFNTELDLIPKIFRSLILTTNFDEVIEMLYAKVNEEYIEKLTPKSMDDVKVVYRRIACGEPTLIKLHGDVATREFVLTEQEYNDTYGEKIIDLRHPLPAFLKDILLSKTILFLGCSLEDDRTLKVLEQAQIDGSISFAFLPLPKETENTESTWEPNLFDDINGLKVEKKEFVQRKQFLNEHNIIPIWYPYGEWGAIKIFLREIAYQINSEFKKSVTTTRKELSQLLIESTEYEKQGNILDAYQQYSKMEKIFATNSWMFSLDDQIKYLQLIKKFYFSYGYGYEKREILTKLITLIESAKGKSSTDLALFYHELGYAFEGYRYYRLMLMAIKRSLKILDNAKKYTKDLKEWYNSAAHIYTSLGYAYLKNEEKENAIIWYKKALHLNESQKICIKSQAFINNGLSRYYILLNDIEKALECLHVALEQRKSINHGDDETLPKHIINTYSNRIHINLSHINAPNLAEKEYNTCMKENDIWNRINIYPESKRRILTDHGDILRAMGDYTGACEEYCKALKYRKCFHFADDFRAADLYIKIGESLEMIPNRMIESFEYLMQAYIILEKMLGNEHERVKEIKLKMKNLGEKLCYEEIVLEQRMTAQRKFLEYRLDEHIEEREDELIQYFNLNGE